MIAIEAKSPISSMTRIFLLAAFVLTMAQIKLMAQNAAPAAPAPAQPNPGLLTPPPDNAPAPAPAAPAPAAPTTTTTTTTTTSNDSTGNSTTTTQKTTTSTPMSQAEIARMQQQEIIRRQEMIFNANQALATAQKAELGGNYPLARDKYLYAAEAYGSVSRSTISYAKAAEGLTRVDFQLYDDALKNGDAQRAKLLVEEILKYNPNNKLAQQRELAINRALANPNDTSLFGDPAVTPGLVKKVNEVQQLLIEAEQYDRTGQWDLEEAKLKRVLGIDPYNKAATAQLEKVTAQKWDYDEKARIETRDERLRQVQEKWYPPIVNKDASVVAEENQPTITRQSNFDIDQRLKNIFLSLDFTNATIEEATTYLSSKSKELDEQGHKGVNFIIQPEASSSAKPITLTLNNVPLVDALRYVCQIANVKYKVQDYAISIVPFNQPTDDLIRRTFNVQPNFVTPPSTATSVTSITSALNRPVPGAAPAAAAAGADTTPTDPVIEALKAKGVTFGPGASAVYTPNTGQLTVVNTADQMELIEELVNAGQAPTLMVRIATKFVEINQSDLNDLTANVGLSYTAAGYPPVGSNTFTKFLTTTTLNTAMPGSGGFAPNSIDQLLQPSTTNFSGLAVEGFIGPVAYNFVLTALSQKKSFDLLSDPFDIVKSGEQGVVESVRVFPYPIAFDPPQLVTPPTNNVANNNVAVINPPVVIATTPTDFKRRNVGVRLVVRPQVTADNKNIDLNLVPEVTDFQGFINYGSPIFVGNPDGSQSLLSSNDINQPVFQTRRITTKVIIRDGSTVVLGGLIRDDVQNINDKVPGLGDLPLIGRLFQSKATESTKRNLIIFVTANIYRNDGELLNAPDVVNAADILTGRASSTPTAGTQ
jgi:general secretion pathway protein D